MRRSVSTSLSVCCVWSGPSPHPVLWQSPCLFAADVDPAVLQAEAERIAVMEKAKDPVLAIFSPSGEGGGSGVVISPDGYALTNFHVACPAAAP